jgi:hypothetical protein
MKKIYSALLLSAVLVLVITSCQKSQDVSPALNSNNSSNSVLAINDSATLTYKDSGVCAMIHGLPSQHNVNYNGFTSFQATVWTYGGTAAPRRSLMKFGFGNLNPNCTPSTLVSAKLYLYQGDELGNNGNYYSIAQVINDAEIRRVKNPWNPATVTWTNFSAAVNTYPGLPTASKNAVALSPIATPFSGNQDNQVVDVTEMVKQMLVPGHNNGFEIRFPNGRETQNYKGRTYASFTNSAVALRPVLKLYWQ